MRKLIMGIVDFRERMLPQYAERFRELALTQERPSRSFEIIDRQEAEGLVDRLGH